MRFRSDLFGDLDGDLLAGLLGDVVALLVVAVAVAGLLVRRRALLLVHPVRLGLVKVLAHLLVRRAALGLEGRVEHLPALLGEVDRHQSYLGLLHHNKVILKNCGMLLSTTSWIFGSNQIQNI